MEYFHRFYRVVIGFLFGVVFPHTPKAYGRNFYMAPISAVYQASVFTSENTDRSHIPAVIVCVCGFLAHTLFSDPLLNSVGFNYSNEGKFYEKFHPGSLLILLSFVMLLARKGRTIAEIGIVMRTYPIYSAFLLLYVLLVPYMGLRSGGGGLAFLIDIHITAGVAAIVLSYAPRSICKKAVALFLGIAALNSIIALIESLGRFRIFTFNPDWVVLMEQHFRSSALLGHPLNNAMFTSVALFIALAVPLKPLPKTALVALLLASLVAFGGRAAMTYSVVAFFFYSSVMLLRLIRSKKMTTRQTFLVSALVIVVPVCLIGGLFGLLQTSLGERLVTHAKWDESANSRFIVFEVFNYLSTPEILLGVSAERIIDVAYRMNLQIPLSDIENPWILMLLNMGLLLYPFWLAVTFALIGKLMWKQPLALKLAVIAYFTIASTSNSFGRKDSIYVITVCIAVCTATLLRQPEEHAKAVA